MGVFSFFNHRGKAHTAFTWKVTRGHLMDTRSHVLWPFLSATVGHKPTYCGQWFLNDLLVNKQKSNKVLHLFTTTYPTTKLAPSELKKQTSPMSLSQADSLPLSHTSISSCCLYSAYQTTKLHHLFYLPFFHLLGIKR